MSRAIAGLVLALALATTAAAAATRPDFTPLIGSKIDLTLPFTDASGRTEPLAAYIGGKPSLILFGYHRCPNLCGVAQLDLGEALRGTGLAADAYTVVFVSVDSHETAADAAASAAKLHKAGPGLDLASWRFLVGDAAALGKLESSIGLTVSEAAHDLYIHPVAVSALTADGRLSSILSGLDYPSADLRQALVQASAGKLGTLGEHILLLCSSILGVGRYTDAAMMAVRLLGIVVMLGLGGGVLLMTLRRQA